MTILENPNEFSLDGSPLEILGVSKSKISKIRMPWSRRPKQKLLRRRKDGVWQHYGVSEKQKYDHGAKFILDASDEWEAKVRAAENDAEDEFDSDEFDEHAQHIADARAAVDDIVTLAIHKINQWGSRSKQGWPEREVSNPNEKNDFRMLNAIGTKTGIHAIVVSHNRRETFTQDEKDTAAKVDEDRGPHGAYGDKFWADFYKDRNFIELHALAANPLLIGTSSGAGIRALHSAAKEWLKIPPAEGTDEPNWTHARWDATENAIGFYTKLGATRDYSGADNYARFTWQRSEIEEWVEHMDRTLEMTDKYRDPVADKNVNLRLARDEELEFFIIVDNLDEEFDSKLEELGNNTGFDPDEDQDVIYHPERYGGSGHKGQLVVQAENEQVRCFGYETENFDICPKSVDAFTKLCSRYEDLAGEKILEAVKLTDEYLGIEKRVIAEDIATWEDVQDMANIISDSHRVIGEISEIVNEDLREDFDYTPGHFKAVLELYKPPHSANTKVRLNHRGFVSRKRSWV